MDGTAAGARRIGLYLGTFPALYVALRRIDPVIAALATLFTVVAVTLCFAKEPAFSLLYLGEKYAAATTEAQRAQLLAAGAAAIALDMWHSTAGYMTGILLQGSGVLVSLVMLRSEDFSKVTAYAGLLGNAFDLFQHLIHPITPSISGVIQMSMGVFYLVWFPMMGRDLLLLARAHSKKEV